MGLYFCVFQGDRDVEGVDVGAYADYAAFLKYVQSAFGRWWRRSRFPVLMGHGGANEQWSVEECGQLERELDELGRELRTRPPVPFRSDWQRESARVALLVPQNALESFIDVDGELLVERLLELARTARRLGQPILFQ